MNRYCRMNVWKPVRSDLLYTRPDMAAQAIVALEDCVKDLQRQIDNIPSQLENTLKIMSDELITYARKYNAGNH